jgi:hypothetical protein
MVEPASGPLSLTRDEADELAAVACREQAEDLIDDHREQLNWRRFGLALWMDDSPFPLMAPDFDRIDRERLRNWCIALADKFLAERGLITGDTDKTRLARSIARAMHKASMTLEGGLYPPLNYTIAPDPIDRAILDHQRRPSGDRGSKNVPLDQLLNGWASEKRPAQKTLYVWRRVLDQLIVFLGHHDAARITADELVRMLHWCSRAQSVRHGRSLLTPPDAGPLRCYWVGAGIGRILDTFHPPAVLTRT